MFVRGGVYRVVREAMGGTYAKFSVSALLFDYVLTGPISGVSAGLYLAGLVNESIDYFHLRLGHLPPEYSAAAFAALIAEPMPPKSPAAADSISGCVVTKDEKYIDLSKFLFENCPRSSVVAELLLSGYCYGKVT